MKVALNDSADDNMILIIPESVKICSTVGPAVLCTTAWLTRIRAVTVENDIAAHVATIDP